MNDTALLLHEEIMREGREYTRDDLRTLAKAKGITLSEDEVKRAVRSLLHKQLVASDKINGGGGGRSTVMVYRRTV